MTHPNPDSPARPVPRKAPLVSRIVCAARGHRFPGWLWTVDEPDFSLGWATCDRCGVVL